MMQSEPATLLESAVAYDGLPIGSGGAHGLGRISARVALDAWLRFLELCTEVSAQKCWFDLPMTPGLSIDPEVKRTIEREFPRVLPGPLSHPVRWDRADDALS